MGRRRDALVAGGVVLAFIVSACASIEGITDITPATDGGGDGSVRDGSEAATGDSGHDSMAPLRDSGAGDTLTGDSSASKDSGGSDVTSIDSTVPPVDSGSQEDSTAPEDSSTGDEDGGEDVVTPEDAGCAVANGCYVIPAGWTLVPFEPSQADTCPAGYAGAAPTDVVEGPDPSTECTCGACAVGTQPTCTGDLAVFYDLNTTHSAPGSCGMAGTPATMSNSPAGSCRTDMFTGTGLGYENLDVKYSPPTTVSGGQCSSPGTPSGSVAYASQDRVCTPDSAQSGGCDGNQCTPSFPSPYLVCVAASGNQSCPGTPFTTQHVVGTGLSAYTCSACGCMVTGATCNQGGTLELFTDNACTAGELSIPADGACHYSNATSNTYGSYTYVANPPTGVGCQSTGTSSPTGAFLTGKQTICCTQ